MLSGYGKSTAVGMVCALLACTHDSAWIAKRTKTGGVIGYEALGGTFTDDDKVRADFNKTAKKLCAGRKWKVTEEVMPPPDGVFGGRPQSLEESAERTGRITTSDARRNAGVLHKDAPVVRYGANANSWNEATVVCGKRNDQGR